MFLQKRDVEEERDEQGCFYRLAKSAISTPCVMAFLDVKPRLFIVLDMNGRPCALAQQLGEKQGANYRNSILQQHDEIMRVIEDSMHSRE